MTYVRCECDFYDQDPDNDTEDGYCHCGHGYYQHEDSGGACLMQGGDGPDAAFHPDVQAFIDGGGA